MLLEAIGEYLIANQKAATVGVDLFYESMPDSPNDLIVLYEYAGLPQAQQETAVHRSVQIAIRHSVALEGKQLAWEIYKLFQQAQSQANRVDFNINTWGQVNLRNTPIKIKKDDQNRVTWAFNLGITTQPD